MRNKGLYAAIILALTSFHSFAQCTSEQQPPSDKPENFDINEHLSKFEKLVKQFLSFLKDLLLEFLVKHMSGRHIWLHCFILDVNMI